MGNQPYDLNPAARDRAGGNRPPTIANLPAVPVPVAGAPRPTVGSHQCPNCGAWAPAGSSVCGECGTRLQAKPQKIRCRLCGSQAQATLVICPHCGRELHPAPSRVLSWGAPTILILLFLLILGQRWESGNPLRWLQTGFAEGRDWVNSVAERLDPQITISTLPADATGTGTTDGLPALPASDQENTFAVPLSNNPTTDQAPVVAGESAPAQAATTAEAAPNANQETTGVAAFAVVTPTATLAEVPATATPAPTPQPTATPTTPAPTATAVPPTPSPVASATSTNAALTTATPTKLTLSALVQALPVVTTPDAVTAANTEARKSQTTTVTILQPTLTDVPTQTPTSTAAPLTYVVQPGDTPLGIAEQFDISVDELMALNGMSVNDARRLRVGQVLTIAAVAPPTATATPTATTASTTATPSPTTTPTPAATNTPQPTTRVDAPLLRSPENSSSLSCSTNNALIWLPVAFIRDSDQYLLHLGFLNGYNADGSEQVTWILEQWRPANVTLWDLDEGLCGLAPQAFGRQWRWYVEVVEPAGSGWQPVSPPSVIGGFSWN